MWRIKRPGFSILAGILFCSTLLLSACSETEPDVSMSVLEVYMTDQSAHNSIGRAMYFTSMTIVAGFSILALSNFIPTIVFGLLTSLAMLVALTGSLTLLPQLLITFKPLGVETHSSGSAAS